MTAENLTLSLDAAVAIRRALLVGLSSLGIIQEAENACEMAALCGHPWPLEARPVHPTGCADTVSEFADALMYLDGAERAARARGEM